MRRLQVRLGGCARSRLNSQRSQNVDEFRCRLRDFIIRIGFGDDAAAGVGQRSTTVTRQLRAADGHHPPPVTVSVAPADVIAAESGVRGASLRKATLIVFRQNRLALAGLVIVLGFLLFCFVGPVFYHTNQIATNVQIANQPPSAKHLLGTDSVGYDELGRLMVG